MLCVQASVSGPVLRQKGEHLLSSTLHKVIRSKTCKLMYTFDLSFSGANILLAFALLFIFC